MSHWPINPRSNLHSLRFSTITRLLLRLNILSPSHLMFWLVLFCYVFYSYLKIVLLVPIWTALLLFHMIITKKLAITHIPIYGTTKKYIYTDKSYTEYSSMSVELVRTLFIFLHSCLPSFKSLGFTLTNLSRYSLDSIDLVDNTVI